MFQSLALFAQISIGPHESSIQSSDWILTFLTGCKFVEEQFSPSNPTPFQAATAPFYRAASLGSFWIPASTLLASLQAERFGIGYRLSTLPSPVLFSTSLHPLNQHALILLSYSSPKNEFDALLVEQGYFEGLSVLLSKMRFHSLKKGFLSAHLSALYWQSSFVSMADQASFGFLGSHLFKQKKRRLDRYLFLLKNQGYDLSYKELEFSFRATLLDPFLYLQAASLFTYVLSGEEFPLLMFPLKTLEWLPTLSLTLAPSGPQWKVEHYLRKNSSFYSGYTLHSFNNGWSGLGLFVPTLLKDEFSSWGFQIDLWKEPSEIKKTKFPLGYRAELITTTRVLGEHSFFLSFSIGYKSEGYLQGTPFTSGCLWSVSLH